MPHPGRRTAGCRMPEIDGCRLPERWKNISSRTPSADCADLRAIDWITGHASTIDVANLSLGDFFDSKEQTENCGVAPKKVSADSIRAAICASVSAGVTYAVSAGNDSIDIVHVKPASYDEVITASAMGDTDGQPGGLGPGLETRPCSLAGNTLPDDSFAYFFSKFCADVDLAAGVCVLLALPRRFVRTQQRHKFLRTFRRGRRGLIQGEPSNTIAGPSACGTVVGCRTRPIPLGPMRSLKAS
jgi:Subtilase family